LPFPLGGGTIHKEYTRWFTRNMTQGYIWKGSKLTSESFFVKGPDGIPSSAIKDTYAERSENVNWAGADMEGEDHLTILLKPSVDAIWPLILRAWFDPKSILKKQNISVNTHDPLSAEYAELVARKLIPKEQLSFVPAVVQNQNCSIALAQ
jgi:hypothetical protein